ncbi:MAG: hypothetical protein JWR63_4470 [Conexibacter sp.]|nr:hypothetical protein [Conexibacter sp.]
MDASPRSDRRTSSVATRAERQGGRAEEQNAHACETRAELPLPAEQLARHLIVQICTVADGSRTSRLDLVCACLALALENQVQTRAADPHLAAREPPLVIGDEQSGRGPLPP